MKRVAIALTVTAGLATSALAHAPTNLRGGHHRNVVVYSGGAPVMLLLRDAGSACPYARAAALARARQAKAVFALY